jgi:hypothetical protein
MEIAGAVDMDGRVAAATERMGIREWSRREAVRHRCAKAQAESENWGGRVNQLSGDDVGIRHDWVWVPFHLIENYLSTMLLRSFKDLEWHRRKKHRHRRLSLLLRGLLATSQSRSSA